jgi:hypothetical protein
LSTKRPPSTRTPVLYSLHITLAAGEINPPIWRRLVVDGRVSLAKLHHYIQAAFGWTDSHLHEFVINDVNYGDLSSIDDLNYGNDVLDERKAFLNRLLTKGDHILYVYDFGDHWEHTIVVESVDDEVEIEEGMAWVDDGARAVPPEDIGGAGEYLRYLEDIFKDPQSEEAKRLREWAGEDFKAELFDRRAANATILRILYNKWSGK